MTSLLRGSLAGLVGSLSLLIASTALADGEACYNDIDCPGTACGDAVCNWSKRTSAPMNEKIFACNPAGSQPDGMDGWCTTDADCKCKGEGAKCVVPYCTFTKPKTGGTGGASSTGGSTSTGGTVASTGGTVASTGGTVASTGGTVASTGGTSSTPTEPADDGGCSVSAPGRVNTGTALGLGLLAVGAVFARRRRR